MSDARINSAREVLAGMEDAAYRKLERGGTVAQAVWDDIEKRRRGIERMERAHAARFGNRQCHCRAHEHGGDCMCFED